MIKVMVIDVGRQRQDIMCGLDSTMLKTRQDPPLGYLDYLGRQGPTTYLHYT